VSYLILTTNPFSGETMRRAGVATSADAIGLNIRFVFGQLPSAQEFAALLGPRPARQDGARLHWLDHLPRDSLGAKKDLGLLELCDPFDSVELWVDPQANDQLVLVWLLDFLRPYREIISKLSLVQTDDAIFNYRPDAVSKWKLPVVKITDRHLTMASRAWQAWCAPTPERCFDLLMQDLMILPRLRSALIALLAELPDRVTCLGAPEMRMLEFISDGCTDPRTILYAAQSRKVFDKREAREMFDELARCPVPVLCGLGEAPFATSGGAHRDSNSQLALTPFGRSIAEGKADFSRQNPIHRWWGGTLLTNDRLWRWDWQTRLLVAPKRRRRRPELAAAASPLS
jgi:hypothetical protein